MANAVIVLPDVYETIQRAVAVSAVSQIAQFMGLPPETQVYFPGRAETVPMNGGMFGNCCDATSAIRFDPEERIEVKYDEIAEENFTLSTAVMNDQNFPIFVDLKHGIFIHPVRRFVDFRIDITYQAPNVVVAQRWLDDQRIKLSEGFGDMTMALEYHYNFPLPMMSLLKGLYDTQEGSAYPTGQPFKEWLLERTVQPNTEMVTQTDTFPQYTVYERQVDVVGHFDFINTPETPVPTSDKAGSYEVTFSYICRYDRPTHMYIEYPMIMNQCPIPKLFRPDYPYQNYQQTDRKTTVLRGSLEKAFMISAERGLPYIQYPPTDTWVAPDEYPTKLTFFTGLLMLNCKDLKAVMDFKSLGTFAFTPWFTELFDTVGDRALGPNSFFDVRLYRNNERLYVPLTMEPGTLKLRTTVDLDPEYYYHVQISLNGNWLQIPKDTWEGLRRYPTAYWNICRMFRVCRGKAPLDKLELLGLGRPRTPNPDWPGEGTTDWTKDVPRFTQGYVRWADIECGRTERADTIPGQTGPNGTDAFTALQGYGPSNVLYFGLIADKLIGGPQ